MRSIWIKWRTRDTKATSITVTQLILFKIIYSMLVTRILVLCDIKISDSYSNLDYVTKIKSPT